MNDHVSFDNDSSQRSKQIKLKFLENSIPLVLYLSTPTQFPIDQLRVDTNPIPNVIVAHNTNHPIPPQNPVVEVCNVPPQQI